MRVIDKAAAQPADHSRALGIHPRTLEVFEQFGIVDEVVAAAKPVEALNICSSRGARGRVAVSALKELDTPWPMMLGLPQARTEALLGKRMEALVRTRAQRCKPQSPCTFLLTFCSTGPGLQGVMQGCI